MYIFATEYFTKEKEYCFMSDIKKKEKNQHILQIQNEAKPIETPATNSVKVNLIYPIVAGIVSSVISSSVILFATRALDNSDKVTTELNNVSTRLTAIETRMAGIENEFEEVDNRFEQMETQLAGLQTKVNENTAEIASISGYLKGMQQKNAEPTAAFLQSFDIDMTKVDSAEYLSAPKWNFTEVLFVNRVEDIEFEAHDLAGVELFVPYTQNGQHVLFRGRYNENNQWDGECTLNIYEDGQLVLIMEAVYNNGVIDSYRQVLPFITSRGDKVWGISERRNNGTENTGITRTYLRTEECVCDFDFSKATLSDMISVNNFSEKYATQLEGIYKGNTSDGRFNDNTGNAYLIKFAKDQTVRTLYVGCVVNGVCEDYTGNAWYIVRDEYNPQMQYMYYKGDFKDNTAYQENKQGTEIHNLTKADIDAKLLEANIEQEILEALQWHDNNS